MTPSLRDLRARFERATIAAGATQSGAAAFEKLVDRYGEAQRHYHTLTHVDACLAWLDWFCGLAERPEEVELALWFHDAIYDAQGSDSERRSANLAREQLAELGVASSIIDVIVRHIEGTERHVATGGDSALVVDLDLAILAAPPRDFDHFEEQIRKEYCHVPDPLYRAGRRRVLEGFLSRSEIYRVAQIREELEGRSRVNLARRVSELIG